MNPNPPRTFRALVFHHVQREEMSQTCMLRSIFREDSKYPFFFFFNSNSFRGCGLYTGSRIFGVFLCISMMKKLSFRRRRCHIGLLFIVSCCNPTKLTGQTSPHGKNQKINLCPNFVPSRKQREQHGNPSSSSH